MLKRFLVFMMLFVPVAACAAPKLAKHQLHGTFQFPNANSGVGIVLSAPPFSSGELPFLNFFKHMTGWQPYIKSFGAGDGGYTGETWYVYKSVLDANGYPATLNPSTQSTFTATISDGAGGSGTIVNVTGLGTGPGPWSGGTISGTGVTGGTILLVPNISGSYAKFTASFSGTSMTVTSFNDAGYITPGMLVSIPTGTNAHVVHCPTSDTLANCSVTGTYTLDTSEPTMSVGIVMAQQVEGTTGYYIATNSLNLGSRMITEDHRFDSLRAEMTVDCTYACYPGGNGTWEMVYDRAGADTGSAFQYSSGHGWSQASHSCAAGTCTDVLNAFPPGWKLELATVDPANPVSNIRLCLLGTSKTTACEQGTDYFNPDWIAQVQQFRTARMMVWNNTVGSLVQVWSGKTPLVWPSWNDFTAVINESTGNSHFGFGGYDPASPFGYNGDVPLEVQVALANEIHSNLWYNVPCLADSTFNTNAANYVLSNLNSNLKAYVEVCNEYWNPGAFIGITTAANLYGAFATAGYNYNSGCGAGVVGFCIQLFYRHQVALASSAWRAVWTGGNATRLKMVLGGQFSFTSHNVADLQATATDWSGTLSTHVDVIATAPYWPFQISLYPPQSWSADADNGVAKMYQDLSTGALKPSTPTAGNCGNGVGFSCTPVDTAHFVVSTGYAGFPGDNPTYAQQGLINDTCISFITKSASTGSPPQLNVDSSGSLPLSGSLNNNELYFTCYQNGIWNVQRSEPLGNCGNGLSLTCAGSDNAHFLLTTGESLADPPPNGKCIFLNNTIGSGATPNFLKTDGGTYYKLVFQGADNQLGTSSISGQTFCFTNQDVNGAVSPAVWELVGTWLQCGPDFLCDPPLTARDLYVAANAASPVALYGYEGGQQIADSGGPTTIEHNMIISLVKSTQFGDLYQQYLTDLKNAGMIEEQLFTDSQLWIGAQNLWGFNPGTYTYTNNITSVIHRQLSIYSWINGNPCWWSGCRIH